MKVVLFTRTLRFATEDVPGSCAWSSGAVPVATHRFCPIKVTLLFIIIYSIYILAFFLGKKPRKEHVDLSLLFWGLPFSTCEKPSYYNLSRMY